MKNDPRYIEAQLKNEWLNATSTYLKGMRKLKGDERESFGLDSPYWEVAAEVGVLVRDLKEDYTQDEVTSAFNRF